MTVNSTGRLKLLLLGSFHVEIDNREIPLECWKSKKALMLFKYLVVRCGEKIPSDVLVDLLWPENDGESGSHNLHTTIYFLRKTLKEASALQDVSSQIRFANGLYWFHKEEEDFVDTIRFIALCRRSEQSEDSDPEEALDAGLKALSLYRGDFLADEPYSDWTANDRAYYREHYIEAALRTSRLLAEHKKEYKRAIRILRKALTIEPYREELHQVVIRYLLDSKRYPEAAAQYRICAEVLQEEFGLEPSAETRALLNRIRDTSDIKDLVDGLEVCPSRGPLVCEPSVFESILQHERRRLERVGKPLTIVSISIKHKHGMSLAAERVLDVVTQTLRKGDVVCRLSGESVAVLLPSTNEFAAPVVIQRIRRTLEAASISGYQLRHFVVKGGSPAAERELVNSL
ncbi:MAG: diguanylate cyclase [Firmicutes bacterium]|nr:diguanylate cyclase [Bacillota bacterium]